MTFLELKELLRKDFFRYYGYYPKNIWIKGLFGREGFRFNFMFRIGHFLMGRNSLLKPIIAFIRKIQIRNTKVSLPKTTHIGPGFCIVHLKNINISKHAKMGSNFTITHQVTIGRVNHGKRKGSPQIGNNVYVGPGALVIGKITIGNNVLIAGNSFVNRDIPSDSIVFGNPCIIKPNKKATEGYIVNEI
jgi:serine O-acetyltransferase